MITLICCTLIALVLFFIAFLFLTAFASGKTILHVLLEFRAIFEYNLVGLEGIIEDILYRKHNRIEPIDKCGRIAVITGGTRGIGEHVIKMLLQCDIKVAMGCRRIDDGIKVFARIRSQGVIKGDLKAYELDTSSLESVRAFAAAIKRDYKQFNYLINNAGIMFAPYKETVDGYESQFATNYLGHFLLTHLLLPELKRAGTDDEFARIVNVSSCVHSIGRFTFKDINKRQMYVPFEAYAQSKLAQLLFSQTLDKLLKDEGAKVQVLSVHPGVVNTDLFQNTWSKQYADWILKFVMKAPHEGAYPIVYSTISPALERKGGIYISNCRPTKVGATAENAKIQDKLFAFSKEITNIQRFGHE